MHYFYNSPEDYAVAATHGVDARSLDRRIRQDGWNKKDAMTTPIRKGTDRRAWSSVAEENGISYATYMTRINHLGWTEEQAATKHLQTTEEAREAALRASESTRILPVGILRLADQNGITRTTLHNRIKAGMNMHEAATKRPMTPQERGRQTKKKLMDRYGDILAPVFTRITQ